MINIDEIIERAPRPKGRKINVTPRKKTKAAVKTKAKPKRKPRRISTPRTFGEEINLPEIGSILPRPTRVDTTPKPKAPSIPSSKDVERIIADLGIEIPEVINIPGVGQVQLPNVQSGGVETPPNIFNDSAKTETDPSEFKVKFFGPKIDPNASELDKLKAQYDHLSGIRFIRDPGPGHWNKLKELAQQIYGLDNTFESPYLKKETQPVETLPVEDPLPVETQPTPPPAPPVNPFEGFVPRNIIGPSFDPKDVSAQQKKVADARARMTPGANIQGGGYLTYDNPMLGNKQTQFGGYGQPMPTAPLMNYAGLAAPTTYSTPNPDPDKEIIR